MKKTLIPLIILLLFAGTAEAKFWKVIKARILAAQVEGVESAGPVTAGTTVNSLYQLLGAEADPSDFPNAMAIFNDYTGAGAGSTAHIGLVIETVGADAQQTIGIDIYPYMFGDRDATGINISGQGTAGRTGDFYGFKVAQASSASGSKNYGFHCDIQNGLSVFCYYGVNGDFYQADTATFGSTVITDGLFQANGTTFGKILRTPAGDSTDDVRLVGIYDGSTLIAFSTINYDHSANSWDFGGNVTAINLVGTKLEVTFGHATVFQPLSPSGDLIFRMRQSAKDFHWDNSVSQTMMTLFGDDPLLSIGWGTTASGRIQLTGADPELSSCGDSPSVVGGDGAGKVTIGSSASDTCTLTFDTAYANAPACTASGDNTAFALASATTTATLIITCPGASDFSGDVISYVCIGL